MREEQAQVDGATLGAFGAAIVIGGANFVAVKVTVDDIAPLYGAAARFALAAAAFIALLMLLGVPLPRGRALAGAAIYGALGFGVAYALMYTALVELSVGMAAVLMATVPVFTLALAALQGMERFTARGVAGGALAVAGIAVLSSRSLGGEVPWPYLLAALVAPVVVAQSAIMAKRFPQTHPIATNAVGMLVGAALLASASVVFGEAWALPTERGTWVAAVWLVLAGSVGLFWLFLFVVQRWTASAATYAVPAMPLVAFALAAVLTDEAVGMEELVGGALVIAGVYVAVLMRARPPAVVTVDPGGCAGAQAAAEQDTVPEPAEAAAR
jgi:drug/metabolite transporter (DMT)-like permease